MGPLTPILMPRCVHSAAKTTFPFQVLLCFTAVLACCAWVWFAAFCLWGPSAAEIWGKILISLSVDACPLALYSTTVIFNFIKMLCLSQVTLNYSMPSTTAGILFVHDTMLLYLPFDQGQINEALKHKQEMFCECL